MIDDTLDELTRTAPERIWLQISDDPDHYDEPYPTDAEVTWCRDSVLACQVKYVRADVVYALHAEVARLNSALDMIGKERDAAMQSLTYMRSAVAAEAALAKELKSRQP